MIDWVDVLRRLMMLYNVKTQAALSMAMGVAVQVGIGTDIQKTGIPWVILERAVRDKQVSWNWLLTGYDIMWDGVEGVTPTRGKPGETDRRQDRGQDHEQNLEHDVDAAWREEPRNDPRIETRELARRLLYESKADGASAADAGAKPADGNGGEGEGGGVQTLEEFKATMEDEVKLIEKMLKEETPPKPDSV